MSDVDDLLRRWSRHALRSSGQREGTMMEGNELCVACDDTILGEGVHIDDADGFTGRMHTKCGLEAHLREIQRKRGPYKRDKLDHATATIAHMASHAGEALELLYKLEKVDA